MANSRRTIRPIRPITPLEPVNIQLGGVDPDIDWLADRLANLSKTAVQIGVLTAAYTQTYSTADRTLAAYTSDPESVAYVGAADGEAKLVDLNALRVAYENLRTFTEDLAALVNAVVDDLQTVGIVP